MKIIKLVAENVKRLHAVSITPDGNLITIGGKNGAGKSSVLDSIAYAMGGAQLVPSEPIRSGESEAKIVVDLGDLVVTRKFTRDRAACDCIASGNDAKPKQHGADPHAKNCSVYIGPMGETRSTLAVTNKDGARYPSPQAVLDKLLGKLTFDPLAFARAEPKEQDAILRRLVGLDVAPIEARRKAAADQRAMLKKTHAIKAAQLAAMPFVNDTPAAEIPMEEISNEMLAAERLRKAAEDAERKADSALDAIRSTEKDCEVNHARISELRDRINALERAATSLSDRLQDEQKRYEAFQIVATAARAAVPDADAIRAKIKNTETMNAAVRANQKRDVADVEVKAMAAQIAETDEQVKQADQDKVNALTAATFPVPGLGLGDDGVMFNGHPFEQAGSAEQVRVSVAIGVALNPQLKVLLIRNGNMLDKASLASVAEQAEAAGMQVWVEMVAEDKDGMTVMMVDGEVV